MFEPSPRRVQLETIAVGGLAGAAIGATMKAGIEAFRKAGEEIERKRRAQEILAAAQEAEQIGAVAKRVIADLAKQVAENERLRHEIKRRDETIRKLRELKVRCEIVHDA